MAKEKSIAEKIAAIIALAEGEKNAGNLGAYENMTAKANEMLLKHNLSRHEVLMAAAESDDKFSEWIYGEKVNYKENLAGERWRMALIKTLSKHNLCGVVFTTKQKYFRVYGDASNVESVVWLYNFLNINLLRLAKEYMKGLSNEVRDTQCRHAWLKDWLIGAVDGIDAKLIEQTNKSPLKAAIGDLILYNKKALAEYVKKIEPGMYTSMPKELNIRQDSYEAGYKTGKNMNLNERKLTAEKVIEKKLLNNK